MNEPTTLGPYLRDERERRGLTLKTISESTKVSIALLEGLEADDISRWPGGIFRRAFVRAYAQCVGLDPDDVFRRFERQYQPPPPVAPAAPGASQVAPANQWPLAEIVSDTAETRPGVPTERARVLGTAADLTVALVLAFASAAAGSRLLWPVLLIAAYYAVGVLLTGTSPMVALLSDESALATRPSTASEAAPSPDANHAAHERRHRPRRAREHARHRRGAQARAQ
jgi:transcriptional regulator with XRE-family HTH domain